MVYVSAVNQPDRMFLSSANDSYNANTPTFSGFDNVFNSSVIEPKKCALIRAQIPNAFPSVPDYCLQFWYYKWLVTSGTGADNRKAGNLRCIRLMPYNWSAPFSIYANMPANKNWSNPNAMVADLNLAAANDNDALNAYYTANDVTFSYDSNTKKISMTGTNSLYYYEPVGYASPNIGINVVNTFVPDYLYGSVGTNTMYQPRVANQTLNMRLGYSQPLDGTGNWQFCKPGGTAIVFDGYPNLIYTQSYYIYASFLANSTVASNQSHNLLCAVPCEAASLAVTNYVNQTNKWLSRLASNINAVRIDIKDDNGQPVPFQDTLNVNMEIGFVYDDPNSKLNYE